MQHYISALHIYSLQAAHSPSTKLHYIPPSTSKTYFQRSFFPRTITDHDWNNLPENIIENDTLDHFTLSLRSYYYNLTIDSDYN